MRSTQPVVAILTLALLLAAPGLAQPPSGLPDVAGIRPGMSAQEAYEALKARSNGAKVGIAQTMLPGVSQPVVVLMSLAVLDSSPAETITVMLTYPPEKQVVWGIRRRLLFQPGKEPTKAAVMKNIREKYGPEINAGGIALWDYDEQGGRPNEKEMIFNHCAGQFSINEPDDPVNPQPQSSLGGAYLGAPNVCSNIISLRTEIDSPSGSNELAGSVILTLEDTPIARRSRQAYDNLVANAGDAAHRQVIDNANQQKAPKF